MCRRTFEIHHSGCADPDAVREKRSTDRQNGGHGALQVRRVAAVGTGAWLAVRAAAGAGLSLRLGVKKSQVTLPAGLRDSAPMSRRPAANVTCASTLKEMH